MRKILIVMISITIFISSCSQASVPESDVQTTIAMTQAVNTSTSIPSPGSTSTSTPTYTLTPTDTPPQPTLIQEPTSTMTQIPPLTGSGGGIIVFSTADHAGHELYLMNADGSGLRELTNTGGCKHQPNWSPDGTRIAFSSGCERAGKEIFVIDVREYLSSGGEVTAFQLTDNNALDENPVWSPDGTQLVFDSLRSGNREIYIMNADGSGVRQITDHSGSDAEPDWSPDGRKIAFSSNRDGDWEIYIMDTDGTNIEQLTDNNLSDRGPAWSPDGMKIAYDSSRDANRDIYVMDVSVEAPPGAYPERRLTRDVGEDLEAAWSPDGSRLAFSRNLTEDNTPGLYTMNALGGDETWLFLTEPDVADWKPVE